MVLINTVWSQSINGLPDKRNDYDQKTWAFHTFLFLQKRHLIARLLILRVNGHVSE